MIIEKKHLILVPESEWKSTSTSIMECVAGAWWFVTPKNEIVYFTKDKGGFVAPQYNWKEYVARYVFSRLSYPIPIEVRKIDKVYMVRRDNTYYWKRKYIEWNANNYKI